MARQIKKNKRQTFHHSAHDANSVLLVGDFTNWQEKPISLQKSKDSDWTVEVDLPPGPHHSASSWMENGRTTPNAQYA